MTEGSTVYDILSPSLANNPYVLAVKGTIGAYMLGTFFSLPLYGLSLYQVYRYLRLYPKDTTYIRIIVATVMVLGSVQAVIAMHSSYYLTVTNYNQPFGLLKPVWSLSLLPVVSNVIITVSQIFFARRVYLLGSFYKIIAVSAMILLLTQTGLGSALSILFLRLKVFPISSMPYAWSYPTYFGCATFADVLLSTSIICAVRRSRAYHPRTDAVFDVFLLYAVKTGLLTGLFNAIPFVWSLARPSDFEWTAFNAIVCKLYANTLLAVLNSRKLSVTRGMEILDGKAFGRGIIARVDHLAATERWNVPQVPDPRDAPIKVDVQMETESDRPYSRSDISFDSLQLKAGAFGTSSAGDVSSVASNSQL